MARLSADQDIEKREKLNDDSVLKKQFWRPELWDSSEALSLHKDV